MSQFAVTAINIYPVKSIRGVAVEESTVLPRGLAGDRRWVVAGPDDRFITGREVPELVRISGHFEPDGIVLSHPDHPSGAPLRLPARPSGGTRARVEVWGDRPEGLVPSTEANEWIAAIAGPGAKLVYMDEQCSRPIEREGAAPGDEVSFADGFPLLLISEASLAGLNQRLADPVEMARFRPNVVVSGCGPHEEDDWSRMRIGEVEFTGAAACARCVFTTVDPQTATRHPNQEPLRTLSSYRRRGQDGVFFGQNLIPRGEGVIRVGDTLAVLA